LQVRLEPTRVEPFTGPHSYGNLLAQGYEPTTQVGAREEPLMRLTPNDRLLALPKNIRLGRTWMVVANTLAYYDTETITAKKVS